MILKFKWMFDHHHISYEPGPLYQLILQYYMYWSSKIHMRQYAFILQSKFITRSH